MGLKAVSTQAGGGSATSSIIGAPAWASGTSYAKNDIVRYGGLMYIALQAGTNHIPPSSPTFWEQTTVTQIETDILNAFP